MPPIDDQRRLDALIVTLSNAYSSAQRHIEAELQAVLDEPTQARRRRRLRALAQEIDQLKDQLDVQAQSWVNNELRVIYGLGGGASATTVGVGFSFTKPHQAALNYIAEQTLGDLLKATKHMQSDAKRLVRASTKEQTLNKLLTGQTAVQAAQGLQGELKRNGISAIVYKDGSRRTIEDYSDMVLRTVSAVAYNQATIVEAKQNDILFAILYDGPGCGLDAHDSLPKANNMIVTLEQARAHPISHPRCVRSIAPLPDIRTKEEAKAAMKAGTYATSAQQDAALVQANELRRGQQRLAARLRAREARINARRAS